MSEVISTCNRKVKCRCTRVPDDQKSNFFLCPLEWKDGLFPPKLLPVGVVPVAPEVERGLAGALDGGDCLKGGVFPPAGGRRPAIPEGGGKNHNTS